MNSADPDCPHEFVVLITGAQARQGVRDRAGLVAHHRINGERFQQLLHQAGSEKIRITRICINARFVDLRHLLRWNQSSCFGNFLPHPVFDGPHQQPLHEALAAHSDENGIQLKRHLVFAWALWSQPVRVNA